MSKSKNLPSKGVKMATKPSVIVNPEDALETAEMIRAAHTLARMAFGACAMVFENLHSDLSSDDKKKEAEHLNRIFNDFMGVLRSNHEYFAKIYASRPKDDVEKASAVVN